MWRTVCPAPVQLKLLQNNHIISEDLDSGKSNSLHCSNIRGCSIERSIEFFFILFALQQRNARESRAAVFVRAVLTGQINYTEQKYYCYVTSARRRGVLQVTKLSRTHILSRLVGKTLFNRFCGVFPRGFSTVLRFR